VLTVFPFFISIFALQREINEHLRVYTEVHVLLEHEEFAEVIYSSLSLSLY